MSDAMGQQIGKAYLREEAAVEKEMLLQQAVLRPPTLREQLESQRRRAQAEVDRLEELIRLLDVNPDTQRILELFGHGGGLANRGY